MIIDLWTMTAAVILVALLFDFVNGFHDSSNSIATIVATKVLSPTKAVIWAALFNFLALFVFGTGVAKTVGSGMVDLNFVTPTVILAGLLGAIIWGLITWWFGLPSSSSHALLGGYAGAAMAHSAYLNGFANMWSPIIASGWQKMLLFILVSPLVGVIIAILLMKLSNVVLKKIKGTAKDKLFGALQLASSAFLSLSHGGNDAQKTAGIITGALLAGGYIQSFEVPDWVLLVSYTTIALGTAFGGWRIVATLGTKLTRLKPQGGFCAEAAAAISIASATGLAMPVSTTHVTTGSILGVGITHPRRAVRLNVAATIAWAWVTTIPATAFAGGCILFLISALP